jgi:DNA-directed RNA polymerase specialized sigma24 family protein
MPSPRFHPFPATHWSLVQRAGVPDEETRREALRNLLERYEPALRSYLLLLRQMPEDAAEELLQAFIADRMLATELFKRADREKGKFRTLLLACLRNFEISMYRARQVRVTVPLARNMHNETEASSDVIVVAAWARSLVNSVLAAMREECRQTQRPDIWTVFEERVVAEAFENRTPTPYEELATRLTLASPHQAANLLVTGKRMYARLLRAAVAEYVLEAGQIDQEIMELREILSNSPADSAF